MTIDDIDLFELNEAFASVVLRYMQAFDIPHDKINVNGGAIAMGHPLGATGAMILGTVLDELERRDLNDRAGDALHRRRHGHGDDHRAGLTQCPRSTSPRLPVDTVNDAIPIRSGSADRRPREASGSATPSASASSASTSRRSSPAPGRRSATGTRSEDEFIYMLEGELVLCEDDGETVLQARRCRGLEGQRRQRPLPDQPQRPRRASIIEVGTRVANETRGLSRHRHAARARRERRALPAQDRRAVSDAEGVTPMPKIDIAEDRRATNNASYPKEFARRHRRAARSRSSATPSG